jgi:micrococcal nuclease
MEVSLAGIRIPGISATGHGRGQTYTRQAKEYLAQLVLNKVVEIKGYGLDRYERVLGVVFLRGRNINLQMVRAGLGEVNRNMPPRGLDLEAYRSVEEEARRAGRGIWAHNIFLDSENESWYYPQCCGQY